MHIARRAVLVGSGSLCVGAATPVILRAADGVMVFGSWERASRARQGTIAMFHMAGSNRGEYAPIAKELARLGWDSLAIDQRSGGQLWGQSNETARGVRGEAGFGQALPDLETALAAVRQDNPAGPILIMGSSYSAALAFVLAAQGVDAVLAFSPGEFIAGRSIRTAASLVTCPLFVTSSSDPAEVADAKRLLEASPSRLKRQYVSSHGTHGASTLRADSNPDGQAENWQAVRDFLSAVKANR